MSADPAPERGQDDFDGSDPTYTHFQHRAEFMSLLSAFLAIPLAADPTPAEDKNESGLVTQLGNILDYYLPMPGLLDPALEDIVPPLMDALAAALDNLQAGKAPNAARLARLGRVVNWVVKVRGWKAVIPYFPSALGHLHVLIALLPDSRLASDDSWELRAVLQLWLALLLTVPFSLAALSDKPGATGLDVPSHKRLFAAPTSDLAARVVLLALPLLHRPGREGEYAALVLARLFARDDAVQGLPGFLDWAGAELADGEREREANFVTSLLSFLAVIPAMIDASHLLTLCTFLNDTLIPHLAGGATAASSGLIRKLAVKARGRWWLARLRDDMDGVEDVLDDLMTALSDKDTIVRYSAAKYLARIAALLPAELAEEIAGATVGLFAGTEDEPVQETSFGAVVDPGGSAVGRGVMGLGGAEASRGEARWHGVCLAVAELARRGLLSDVAEAVPWILKALGFDLRRASHSVGANVRDAGAYVLWSLSRAAPPEQLAPFAERLATALICAATLDREVGVRRAASAAFQEGVGRLGLYPAGIDVLAKTDFYSVSVRRKAFAVAAPAVAAHPVYRAALREHLHNITLRHWDVAMRTGGAGTLAALLALAPEDVGNSTTRELACVAAFDPTSAHGALIALAQIAPSVGDEQKNEFIVALARVRAAALITSNAAEIIAAGCALTEAALTPSTDFAPAQRFFDAAERRREPEVHEALAAAGRRYSQVYEPVVVDKLTRRAVDHLASARPTQRQANALLLGHIEYRSREAMAPALGALLGLLEPAAKADVETRRNAVRSLADLAVQTAGAELILDATDFARVVVALTKALEDYATDQRGDVGSWVRAAAVCALSRVLVAAASCPRPLDLVSQDAFAAATGGMAKQALEKLDVVRGAATAAWGDLLAANADSVWSWPGARCMLDGSQMRPSPEWFTAGLELLRTPARAAMLSGLVQIAGSAVHSSSDRAAAPLVQWLSALPAGDETHALVLADLCTLLGANLGGNRVAVPTLTTLARLFAAETPISSDPGVYTRALSLATRGVPAFKSIDRITAALRLVVATLTLPFDRVQTAAAAALPAFLAHRFPRIRAAAAESTYLALEEEGELDPELEEMLLETNWAEEADAEAAGRVAELVRDCISGRQKDGVDV
ncbi:ARM repeat-containing protein [Cutaneotrichosporon oleaginosum]|uniref:ARM repeat-containing protein n=1 Tax=Cutaneotrichosporon oleaginosum TaxID=879819 RepID=A0A0J0XR17_9TREE|nr:ARM repeat-containing protein [Cutaneotrichosporon oleaginosum]KLT43561.1 ARM repeat-containing protein [Cutaneotrichosporon oleaginosum]TXT05540.1 hypothetical protein COLE_06860 [Cutaneotrichosporon oleaginosum]